MGFEKQTVIKKPQGSNELVWMGEKNLLLYDQEFESHLKTATTEFYKQKAEEWASMYSCHEYILKVNQHLRKEEENADMFLQPETKQRIVEITLREVVENQAEQLTLKESGCEYMFNERKIDQLTMMYNVYSRVEKTLKYIINKMNPYIM